MNLSDLCPEGLEKYAEFEKFREAARVYGLVQSIVMMNVRHQEFKEHVMDFELCKEE